MHKQIPSLNGLRAISIIIVIFYHFDNGNFLLKNGLTQNLGLLFLNGALGVNIFFFISGYLITTLLIQEINRNGVISLKKFYTRRTIRIFPAYYSLLVIYAILQSFGYLKLGFYDWLSAITYTRQFYQKGAYELGHLWSLSVEELFYLFWPFIFIKFKYNKSLIVISLILLTTLYRLFSFDIYNNFYLHHTIFYSADALLLGCLFALFNKKISEWIQQRPKIVLVSFILLVACLLLERYLPRIINNYILHQAKNAPLPIVSAFNYSFFGSIGLVTNIFIGMIVVGSIYGKGIWFKILNIKPMDYIGKLSYSLYLWQQIFTADRPILHKLPLVLLLFIIIVAAHISYFGIELPFLKLKKRFSS